jgi:flagellum-specific ATP synthase
MNAAQATLESVRHQALARRTGRVRQLQGLAIESAGPEAAIGELCRVSLRGAGGGAESSLLTEVVGIKPGLVTLMPYGPLQGVAAGCEVQALHELADLAVGPELLGRVIDGFGYALDGRADPRPTQRRPLKAVPHNPMHRPPIKQVLETGVRSIDALLTLGKGQRMGIFAGSGVGKSTLLGMIARHVSADINVIALIGERGREVREFIERQLGPQGLQRSVVVVATSDQPALARLRAAHAALAIAEHFQTQGRDVLLTMDSVTRYAMARREIGLSAGEPPTARGYTPSVFAELPQLCERCGTHAGGGSITALFTVLVEGDDFNEPVADSLRAILDGHIVLSRQLAHQGQFPAVDCLRSASRLIGELATPPEREMASRAVQLMALLDRNHQMVEMGAYEAGNNPALDAALKAQPALHAWLTQSEGGITRADALTQLSRIVSSLPRGEAKGGAKHEPR